METLQNTFLYWNLLSMRWSTIFFIKILYEEQYKNVQHRTEFNWVSLSNMRWLPRLYLLDSEEETEFFYAFKPPGSSGFSRKYWKKEKWVKPSIATRREINSLMRNHYWPPEKTMNLQMLEDCLKGFGIKGNHKKYRTHIWRTRAVFLFSES